MTGSVVVIGAINVDLVVSGAPLPAPGQTVTGGVFAQHHGGKGGNQAVAASRALGGQGVVLVGAVGNDALGHDALEALRAEGVATSVAMRPGVPTGVALICVGPDGENQISVAPGANAELTAADVTSAFGQVHEIGVVLASLEVSQAAVRAAAAWCSEHETPLIAEPRAGAAVGRRAWRRSPPTSRPTSTSSKRWDRSPMAWSWSRREDPRV